MERAVITIRVTEEAKAKVEAAAKKSGTSLSHLAGAIFSCAVHNMDARGRENDLIMFLKDFKAEQRENFDFDEALAAYRKARKTGRGHDELNLLDGFIRTSADYGFNMPEWLKKGQE